MKLAVKLAAVLTLLLFTSLTVYGFVRVERERVLFASRVADDGRIVARSLARVFDGLLQSEERAKALALVRRANADSEALIVRWVSAERVSEVARVALRTESDVLVSEDDPEGGLRVVAYGAVRHGPDLVGAIKVTGSRKHVRAYISESIASLVMFSVLIAAVCGAVILGLGYVLIGRPLRRLVMVAQRAGEGDLTARAEITQRDEIGQLADAWNRSLEQLAASRDQLRDEARARVASEERLRHADRLATIGTLAAAVAHELGTPLNVIMGRAAMIVSGEMEGELARKGAAIIETQVERMARYIRELLDFARVRESEYVVQDVLRVVQHTFDLIRPLAHKRNCQLILDESSEPSHSRIDAGAIQQTLTNLIVNAVQAMPRGGRVRVRVRRSDAGPPGSADTSDWIELTVEDEGPGIPSELRVHLFDTFFTTKPVGEGTGLGLSVAHEIVKDHDGTIEVDSGTSGAVFTVWLPAAD